MTRIVQAHKGLRREYFPLYCAPPPSPRVLPALSIPTCQDHGPKALDKQDKLRNMGAAILFTQRLLGWGLRVKSLGQERRRKGRSLPGCGIFQGARPPSKCERRERARARGARTARAR